MVFSLLLSPGLVFAQQNVCPREGMPCDDNRTCPPDQVCFCGSDTEYRPVCRAPRTQSECSEVPDKTWVEVLRSCLDLGEFLGAVLNYLMGFAAGLAMIRIAIGGWQMIFASGDPKSLEDARATLTQAILGFILVAFAFLLTRFIAGGIPKEWQVFFGVSP